MVTVRKAEERDCRDEKRSNATHVSRTDPASELMRKGMEAPALRCAPRGREPESSGGGGGGDGIQFAANSQFAIGVVEIKKKMASGRPLDIEKLKK
jgi:hypothetical protein